MLATQVAYWGNVETQRHNTAAELQAKADLTERIRSNLAHEELELTKIRETVRHNLEAERLNSNIYLENLRHNVEQEKVSWANISENVRANKANEDIKRAQLLLNEASILVDKTNAETRQFEAATNLKSYELSKDSINSQIAYRNAQIDLLDAQTAKTNAEIGYLGQSNLRSWIDTGLDVVNSVPTVLSNLRKAKGSKKTLKVR